MSFQAFRPSRERLGSGKGFGEKAEQPDHARHRARGGSSIRLDSCYVQKWFISSAGLCGGSFSFMAPQEGREKKDLPQTDILSLLTQLLSWFNAQFPQNALVPWLMVT